jgi:subtilisin family serine protease
VSKDVLLVHASGNDAKNTDVETNYPQPRYENGETAATWIEVGASSWKKKTEAVAEFSNYGKNTVDVLAPGVDIYSCLPNSTYGTFSGTSMAAPVTTGVAAMIRAYYPRLTALQVKEILLKSVVPVKGKVQVPGDEKKKVKARELCRTGGVENARNAMKLAAKRSKAL